MKKLLVLIALLLTSCNQNVHSIKPKTNEEYVYIIFKTTIYWNYDYIKEFETVYSEITIDRTYRYGEHKFIIEVYDDGKIYFPLNNISYWGLDYGRN